MVKREKVAITIFATVIVLAIGLSLYDWPSRKIPHVTMISSYDIRNVGSLYDFKDKRIDNIKVTTWTNLTYSMKRDESGIHVQIRNEENKLLTETTCGDFLIYYVPESWSPDQVQLQSCKPGEETYTLGSIN
ncbi:hypothetical protein [Sporosarcina sp. Marseille-Q4943]|uniref:hypothetical protein n=1 Tax=Sporosarcina sp. Marseille-Q4943 TaxID=2942204 RepID=UPI00208DA5C8|nr:hypothetical protein [Sporosarcina sp. Marseille-Q4943]